MVLADYYDGPYKLFLSLHIVCAVVGFGSVVLYIVAIGLSHAIMIPGAKRLGVLMSEMVNGPPPTGGPPPQVAEMQTIGQRMGTVGPILDLILVVIIFLM